MEPKTLLDRISVYNPDVDDIILQTATVDVVRDFMRRTKVFTDWVDIDPQRGVYEYVVIPKATQNLDSIQEVLVDKRPFSGWQRDEHHDVVIFNQDLCGSCVEVKYTYVIPYDQCIWPDKLLDYLDIIISGVKAKTLPIVNKALADDLKGESNAFRMMRSILVDARTREQQAKLEYETGIHNVIARRVNNFSKSSMTMHRIQPGTSRFNQRRYR